MKKNTKGFTLVELLVVVIIIAILAVIAVPQYGKMVEKSRMADALVNVKAISDSANRYYMARGSYRNMVIDPNSSSLNLDIKPTDSPYYKFLATTPTDNNNQVIIYAVRKYKTTDNPTSVTQGRYYVTYTLDRGNIRNATCTAVDCDDSASKTCEMVNYSLK
ncbi:prepilin-type N-terminal cleavage/methylation domain-containing protein [Elusimicrobium posterum]|uniref:type IV pilin protein n=1 Tax=Elusimicrobium posterum TaxID=3116653 RepID=UPI003C78D8B2